MTGTDTNIQTNFTNFGGYLSKIGTLSNVRPLFNIMSNPTDYTAYYKEYIGNVGTKGTITQTSGLSGALVNGTDYIPFGCTKLNIIMIGAGSGGTGGNDYSPISEGCSGWFAAYSVPINSNINKFDYDIPGGGGEERERIMVIRVGADIQGSPVILRMLKSQRMPNYSIYQLELR